MINLNFVWYIGIIVISLIILIEIINYLLKKKHICKEEFEGLKK